MSAERTTLKGAPLVLAPGKLFLCGEYAVLEGGVAVLAAVGRYADGAVPARARAGEPR